MGTVGIYIPCEMKNLEAFLLRLEKGDRSRFVIEALKRHNVQIIKDIIFESQQNTEKWMGIERDFKVIAEEYSQNKSINLAWFNKFVENEIGEARENRYLKNYAYAPETQKVLKEHGYSSEDFIQEVEKKRGSNDRPGSY